MIDDLIKYYSNSLTFHSLVLKKHGFFKNLMFYSSFLITICLPLTAVLIGKYYLALSVFPAMAITIIITTRINASTIKDLYPAIYKSNYSWSRKELDALIHKKLDTYFKNNFSENQIDDVLEIIRRKAKNAKLPFAFAISILVALTIPLWQSLSDIILTNFQDDLGLMSDVAIFLFLGIVTVVVFIPQLYDIQNVLIPTYRKLTDLAELIEDYKLSKSNAPIPTAKNDTLEELRT